MNDLISRKDAITAIFNEITTRRLNGDEPMDEYKAEAILTNLKPAAQRTGKWIVHHENITFYNGATASGGVMCSECGWKTHNNLQMLLGRPPFNYCPNCGAKMKNE